MRDTATWADVPNSLLWALVVHPRYQKLALKELRRRRAAELAADPDLTTSRMLVLRAPTPRRRARRD